MEQQSLSYNIQLDSFEGPLDLLLHLIEKNKIDIYDIPIAVLTEQYMDYLNAMQEFNMDIASEFLVMAATLLQIKSRILLPDAVMDEEQGEEEALDPRLELVERLLEYKRYKEVSSKLEELQAEAGNRYFRQGEKLVRHHAPPMGMDISLLMKAFQNVLEGKLEYQPPVVNVQREQYTIEDKIVELLARLKEHNGSMSFDQAFAYDVQRSEVVVTFLAMLELIKIKRINIYQTGVFTPIYIRINEEVRDEDSAEILN